MNRKAVMGIGVLIIFIATVLVSAVAAGVMIKSTGLLQEKALQVEDATRSRLSNGIDIFIVNAKGNTTTEKVNDLEFFVRLRAGSNSLQMRTLGLTIDGPAFSASGTLNSSMIGANCTFDNLPEESYFCYENRLGDTDTILTDTELLVIRYKLSDAHAMNTSTQFYATFLPQGGSVETLELKTPSIILSDAIRLR